MTKKPTYAELESALVSERAKTAAAEAIIARVLVIAETYEYTRLAVVLSAAPTAALDAALAEARAGAQKEMLAWLDLRIDAEELDMAAEIFGVDITWANRPARAAQIRKTQQ